MSPTLRRIGIAAAAALVLAAVDLSIVRKERIRREGTVLFLELAPVDPRSLMQGDYMALRFTLADALAARARAPLPRGGAAGVADRPAGEGGFAWAPIRLDARGVATLTAEAEASSALRLRYRLRNGRPWLGTNAFFFPEGEAARFAPARFGEFRLDPASGEAVLVGLRDVDLRPL